MNERTFALDRRSFLITSGVLASTAALAACSSGKTAGSATAASKSITGSGWIDPITDMVFGPIAKGFETKTGIKVIAQAPVPFPDYNTRFRTQLAGGSPPAAMRLNDDFLREMSDKKAVLDLRPYIEKSKLNIPTDYFESLWDYSKMPTGEHTAAIAGTQTRVIFYNKTLFQKEGVPLPPTTWTDKGWKWEDFLSASKALTKGTNQYGALLYKDTAIEETFSRNNGGAGIFSPDGLKFTLADPQGIEAMQWIADLTLKTKVQPTWGAMLPQDADLQLFVAGKLGMLMRSSSTAAYFQKNVKDFEWDIAPMPAKVHQFQNGGVVVFVIPTKAKNPDLAWEFLNYVCGPEGGKQLAAGGLCIPVNREAAKSQAQGGQYPKHFGLFAEAAAFNVNINTSSGAAEAVALYRPQLERVWVGEITAKEALTSVKAQVESALATKG